MMHVKVYSVYLWGHNSIPLCVFIVSLHLRFWDWVSHWTWNWLIWLDCWPGNPKNPPVSIWFPSTGTTGRLGCAQLFPRLMETWTQVFMLAWQALCWVIIQAPNAGFENINCFSFKGLKMMWLESKNFSGWFYFWSFWVLVWSSPINLF